MTQDSLIYVNGDSFAEGIDIAEQVYFKESAPDQISYKYFYNNVDQLFESQKNYIDWLQNIHQDISMYNTIKKIQCELVWSTKLEQLINEKVLNCASAGASNSNIYWRTVRDIKLIKQENINVKKIIIQATSVYRYGYLIQKNELELESYPINHYKNYIHRSLNTGSITLKNPSKLQKNEYQFMVNYDPRILTNDLNITTRLVNTLLELRTLKHAIQGATDIETHIVDSQFVYFQSMTQRTLDYLLGKNKDDELINELIEDLWPYGYVGMPTLFDHDVKNVTRGHHLDHTVHELFAHEVAEKLF